MYLFVYKENYEHETADTNQIPVKCIFQLEIPKCDVGMFQNRPEMCRECFSIVQLLVADNNITLQQLTKTKLR